MPYPYSKGVLAVLADPRFYPHVERHLYALLQVCGQVEVLAVFPPGALPVQDRVTYVSVAPELPQGVVAFARCMRAFYRLLKDSPAELVEAVDPPALFPAALALKGKSSRLVYFSMEIYPELPSLAARPWKRRLWAFLERWGARRAQSVLSVNASVASVISDNLGQVPVGVVRSIPWKLGEHPCKNAPLSLRSRCGVAPTVPLLVYQGVVEKGRGLQALADALMARPHVHLAVMGFGPLCDWVRSRAGEQANIHFLGAFPFEELLTLTREASAGVVCIEPLSRSFRLSLPGKLFEYVGCGLPVLGSPLPEISKHIYEAGVGEVASTHSAQDIGAALDRLLQGIETKRYTEALRLAGEGWNWQTESKALVAAYLPDRSNPDA